MLADKTPVDIKDLLRQLYKEDNASITNVCYNYDVKTMLKDRRQQADVPLTNYRSQYIDLKYMADELKAKKKEPLLKSIGSNMLSRQLIANKGAAFQT